MRLRPRLIHLADYGSEYTGSFIPMLIELGEGARADGFEVTFAFPAEAEHRPWVESLRAAGFDCVFLAVDRRPHGKLLPLLAQEASGRFATPLSAAVAGLLPDDGSAAILHSHFASFDEAAAYAARARPATHAIWHEHLVRPGGWVGTAAGVVKYRLIGRNVDRFLCVGPAVTESVRSLAGPGRVMFVPNAIDTARFRPASGEARLAARRALGVSPAATVLLHFGLDWDGKGGESFLAAIDELEVVGVIVGREATAAAVRRSGVGGDVRVVAPGEDVERFYAAADVLVSPSHSEGMPLAMLEALASSVPVVASDIPGHRLIAGSVSACVLARADGADLGARIREVLGWGAERRQAEAEAARAWVVTNADLRPWGARIRRLYRELVAAESG